MAIWEIMGKVDRRGARRIGEILILLSFRPEILWKVEMGLNRLLKKN
jgi:hypothetical protein